VPDWEEGRYWYYGEILGAIMEMIQENRPLFGGVPVIVPARITEGHMRSTKWEVVE
jgi:hypothetical protein